MERRGGGRGKPQFILWGEAFRNTKIQINKNNVVSVFILLKSDKQFYFYFVYVFSKFTFHIKCKQTICME